MRQSRNPIVVTAAVLVSTSLMLVACGKTDETVAMVKGGTLQVCPGATVEQMVNGFMENPSWTPVMGENNVKFVNVGGNISYAEKPVRAVVQFVVNEKEGSFQYQAFEINEVPQDNPTASALLEKMCESTRKATTTQAKDEQTHSQSGGTKYSRAELIDKLTGKSKADVLKILGKPSESAGSETTLLMWTYEGISYDSDTGTADSFAQVQFMKGAVFQIVFK